MRDTSTQDTITGATGLAAAVPGFAATNKLDRFLYTDVPMLRGSILSPLNSGMTDDVVRGRFQEMSESADRLLSARNYNEVALTKARNEVALNALRRLGVKNIPLVDTKVTSDPSNSLWHMMRAYGFNDKSPEHLQMLKARGGQMARGLYRESAGGLMRHAKAIKLLRPLLPAAPLALAGFGTWNLTKGLSGQKWASDNTDALGAAGLGTAAGGLGYDAARDLTNRNVMVTYGDAEALGGGHKSTANSIQEVLDDVRRENPRFSKLNIHMAPTSLDGLRLRDPKLNRKRYLMSVDPGWGVTDDFRNERGFMREGWRNRDVNTLGSDLIHVNQSTGRLEGNRTLGSNILKKVVVQPDGMGQTGYRASGTSNKTVPLGRRDYHHVWYGTLDPYGDKGTGRGYTHYTGKYHPLVKLTDVPSPMSREAWLGKLHEYMQQSAGGREIPTLEQLAGKKIITVSGASRGDTVGTRMRQVLEALEKGGLTDSHYVVGLGSGGAARERLLAEGLEQGGRNFFVGGRPGGPTGMTPDFINLANNSDFHFMGLGGSTPPEMLAHGGAPIAMPKAEQVFYGREPWAGTLGLRGDRAWMDPQQGLQKLEVDRINELKAGVKHLPAGNPLREMVNKLAPPEARDWMNMVLHHSRVDNQGKPEVLRRGLDGIREMLEQHGVREVETSDDILKLLRDPGFMDRGKWLAESSAVREGLVDSKSTFKNALVELLHAARNKAVTRGSAKMVGAAGLLGGAGYLMNRATAPRPWWGRKQASQWSRSLDEFRQRRDMNPVADAGALVGAGLLTDTALQFRQAGRQGARMEDLANKIVRERMQALDSPVHGGRLLDQYADLAKSMLDTRVMGARASTIARRLPFASVVPAEGARLGDHLKAVINFAGGRYHKMTPKQYADFSYGADHYKAFGANEGRQAILNEAVSNSPKRIGQSVYRYVEEMFPRDQLRRFINLLPGETLESHLSGISSEQYDGTVAKRLKELFLGDRGGNQPKSFFSSPAFNTEKALAAGPRQYARAAKGLGRYGAPAAAVAATGLAAMPALDMFQAWKVSKGHDPRKWIPN